MTTILDTISCVRMTASRAEAMFRTAEPILGVTLKPVHLDMLQMVDIDIETRALLGDASDDLEAGRLHTPAVRAMAAAFNARCSKLTADTITPAQIRDLRGDAVAAGDDRQVDYCDVALAAYRRENADGSALVWPWNGQPADRDVAREVCANSINAARAEGE